MAGELPDDAKGAGVLSGRLVGRGWQRLRLPRAARAIAWRLHDARPRPAIPPVLHGTRVEAHQ